MKKTDLLIRIVTLVVFIAILAYAGYAVYDTLNDPFKTVMAIEWDVSRSVATEGFAVREETPVKTDGDDVYVLAEEGARVAAGEAVAMRYSGEDAMERADRIRALRLETEQLSALRSAENTSVNGQRSVIDLAKTVAGGNLENLDEAAAEIKVNVFSDMGKYSDAEITAAINERQKELNALTKRSDGMQEICAEKAGTFSSHLDGFEKISPEDVTYITPSEYKNIFASKQAETQAAGKIIGGIKWYYVTCVKEDDIRELDVGDAVTLDFSRTYNGTVSMTVESIGREENGLCVILFSSKKSMQDVAAIREMTADIVFSRSSGIRVPREAVRLDEDGKTFVYVLQGVQARKAYITIEAEEGDYYLALPEDSNLAAGTQIITKGTGMEDGKVVS